MQGYIKLHRSILGWEWYTDIPVRILFEHCLLRANHKENKWRGITIKQGSFITSFEKLSKETGLTIRQVRTALNKLKMTGELTHKGQSKYSIITINNWDEFQENDKQLDKQTTNKRQTNDKQMTTINNDKNDNNEKNENKNILCFEKKEKNIFEPPTKDEIIAYAKNQLAKHIDADAFIAYWQANDWKDKDGFYINWKQKVVNWTLNARNDTLINEYDGIDMSTLEGQSLAFARWQEKRGLNGNT